MKISLIAAIIESVYNNGRISSDSRLDIEDFEQLSLASAGPIIRLIYYEEKKNGIVSAFISELLELKEMEVTKGPRGIKSLDVSIFAIPHGLGLFNIYPVDECEKSDVDYEFGFTRLETGSEKIFNAKMLDDVGINAFALRGGKPVLYCDDNVKRVLVEGIFRGADMDVPEYVGKQIINDVLGDTLKVAGWPIDMNDNSNPNTKILNAKIAEPQSL